MQLLDNWRDILKHAWSIRLNVLAIFFAWGEVVLPLFTTFVPEHLMALLAGFAVAGSTYFRLFYQPNLHE
jgi:hypothetical protein